MSKLMIFQNILPECEEGNSEAWKAFLSNYTPTALHLFTFYTPWPPGARLDAWRDALHALSVNEFASLKEFSHQSEREFLVGLRAFLLDWVAPRLRPEQDAAHPPAPTLAELGALFEGLPLLHQEIAFLTLAGYSPAALENMLRITPALAEQGLSRLRARYAAILERSDDQCQWPFAWNAITHAARAGEQKDCIPLRQLIRLLDGQTSWYDKSPAETHRSKCLHCLERWTALLEAVAWDRTRQPLLAEEMESLLAVIPLKQEKRKASLFTRMLRK